MFPSIKYYYFSDATEGGGATTAIKGVTKIIALNAISITVTVHSVTKAMTNATVI